jgi:ribosome-associated heat shock protein Hsp15
MEETIRVDRLLFFLRLAKSRTLAQVWTDAGHIRVNGRRIEKSSAEIKVGDILTFPRGDDVLAIKLLEMPSRRGPPSEAQACYLVL